MVPDKPCEAYKSLPFRWIFPLGQLVLCALLLWPVRPRIALAFHLPMLAQPPAIFQLGGPLAVFARWADNQGMDTVALLNLPAGVVQVPYIVMNRSKKEWMPSSEFDFKVWRAVTWPLLGTVFWWIAGRGAEAVAASRRKILVPQMHWIETVVGFLLFAMGTTFVFGFVFFAGQDRHDLILQVLAFAAGLWAFLGSLSFGAKIAQWRLRKRLTTEQRAAAN